MSQDAESYLKKLSYYHEMSKSYEHPFIWISFLEISISSISSPFVEINILNTTVRCPKSAAVLSQLIA